MNKTRKNPHESIRSGSDLLSGRQPKIGVTTGQPRKIRELSQENPQIWKPIELYSDDDAATWFALTQDLLHDFDQLVKQFHHAIIHRSWLNAYLLAAGMSQVVEDHLHSRYSLLPKVAAYLLELPGPAGALLAKLSPHILSLWGLLVAHHHADANLRAWQGKLSGWLERLAGNLLTYDPPDQLVEDGLVADGGNLMAYVPYFPLSLRSSIVQLPASFRSFDQQPEDFRRIVDEFSIHWPELEKPIVVVGVRPSGNYLVPFYTTALRSLGYRNVHTITLHPDSPLLNHELEVMQSVRDNGLALLCDAPPTTGRDLIDSAILLEEMGFPKSNIILMLGLLGNYDALPDELQNYPSVLLSWENWSIFRKLDLTSVRKVLSTACDPSYELVDLERIPYVDGVEKREHVFARYRANLFSSTTHQEYHCTIQVQGVGLGYLGEHVLAISQRLPGYSARLIALKDGLLFQEISASAQPLTASEFIHDNKSIDYLINYIVERNYQLPTTQDLSLKLDGRHAAWEVARDLLRNVSERDRFSNRASLLDAYLKDVLKPSNPSIIDGDMSLKHWYLQDGDGIPLIKAFMADKDFSQLGLWCYDPVYDLASLALEVNPIVQPFQLRHAYEALTGIPITAEKWLIYQLVHLWDQNPDNPEQFTSIARQMSQAVERYFSELYFQDVDILEDGPLCTFDIDGLLETDPLGFMSLSPASARSLRALHMHGYRPLLATGHSLEELVDRCVAYKLPGGVAEFGAVLYDHVSGRTESLLKEPEQDMLNKIRSRLSNKRDVFLDNDYRFAVRAYFQDGTGCREKLDEELIEQVLLETETSGQVYAIQGDDQTDFMVKRIDKGVGLKAWLTYFDPASNHSTLNPNDFKPFALAVGDSNTDLPILALASKAYAPANASLGVKQAGVSQTSRSNQHGFEQALGNLLGHHPGSCSTCKHKPLSYSSIYMQDLLSGNAYAHPGALWQVLKQSVISKRLIHVKSK